MCYLSIYLFFNAEQHSTEVENALDAVKRILDSATVSVSDKRLGALFAAVTGLVTEEGVIENSSKRLPKHAVPVMVQDELIGGCLFPSLSLFSSY